MEWRLKVIITWFTFCCDNLWISKFMALEKPGKLREIFLLLYGHPAGAFFWCWNADTEVCIMHWQDMLTPFLSTAEALQWKIELIGWLDGWLTGWLLSNPFFVKWCLRKYKWCEVETLHVGTGGWESAFADGRGLLFPGDFVTSVYMPQQCFSSIRQMATLSQLTAADRRQN